MKTGRNDPCPCGSGRKYKVCHLASDTAANAATTANTRSPLHELDNRVVGDILEFITQKFPYDVRDAVTALHSHPHVTEELLASWLAWVEPFEGRTAASWYEEARGWSLSAGVTDWIAAQRGVPFSIWQVRELARGRTVTLADQLTGDVRTIHEVKLSQSIEPLYCLIARVIDHQGVSLLCGVHAVPMRPLDAQWIVDEVRRKLRRRKLTRAHLLEPRAPWRILDTWSDTIDRLSRPPDLRNNDGDPILLTVDRWRVTARDRPEVTRRLAALEGAFDDGPRVALVRPEDDVTLASVRWDPEEAAQEGIHTLMVETNSRERADAIRARVEHACGPWLTGHLRSHTDPLSSFPEPGEESTVSEPDEELSAEQSTMIREMKERHYADWLDQPLPLLDGKTPREGVRTKRGRELLTALFDDMDVREATLPPETRFDANVLRRALGIPMREG